MDQKNEINKEAPKQILASKTERAKITMTKIESIMNLKDRIIQIKNDWYHISGNFSEREDAKEGPQISKECQKSQIIKASSVNPIASSKPKVITLK